MTSSVTSCVVESSVVTSVILLPVVWTSGEVVISLVYFSLINVVVLSSGESVCAEPAITFSLVYFFYHKEIGYQN